VAVRILGISAYYHDSAACLVEDGRVVAVLQSDQQLADRISRLDTGQPAKHVLQLAGRDLARAAAPVGVLGQSVGHGVHAAPGRVRPTQEGLS